MSVAQRIEPSIGMPARISSAVEALNTRYHRTALRVFMVIVFAHLAEHIVQAIQIWGLGWAPPDSRGVLGMAVPWLVTSEAMHYGYAIVMLVGLVLLRPGFVGTSRSWWNAALIIQIWHHLEHAVLLGQAVAGSTLFGQEVNTSIAQLVVPRVELHLLYNTLVLIPMIVAMVNHVRPPEADRAEMRCSCAAHSHAH